jgi:glyoxylase-like metal-dependent hydrolase (beta-lactamase superfamily II)
VKISTIDLQFLGLEHAIAVFVIETNVGPVLIECGPASTLPHLKRVLEEKGWPIDAFQHVFLTHIHFDHAGSAWEFAQNGAKIYVHPIGLPHLAAPEKLYNSARMIYGTEMDRLWGEMQPIDALHLYAPEDEEIIQLGQMTFRAIYTPGHATHHIAWEVSDPTKPGDAAIFTGDVAGVKIDAGPVMPPCPPPDINIEDWQESLIKLRKSTANRLFLTHFGEVSDKDTHLNALEKRLVEWAHWMKPHFDSNTNVETIVPLFQKFVQSQLLEEGIPASDLARYEAANPSFMSVAGLLRYWKKKTSTTTPHKG